jgi:hypothetical protein
MVIGPMYLSLGLGGARELRPESLFDVGMRLQRAMTACRQTGCTPVFVHHGKNIGLGRVPKLVDLQYAGFRQYAGQWLLLNLLANYADDGKHRLVLVAGGTGTPAAGWPRWTRARRATP